MKKRIPDLPGVKKPTTGFNHIVEAGNFIFLSSQISANLDTGEIIKGDIKEQTKTATENIKYLLSECNCTMDDIARAVIYFRNPNDRQEINEVYNQYFTKGQEPAKSSIQAASPIEGIDIEIEVTAFLN